MSLFPRGDPLASCSPLFAFNCANGCFVAKAKGKEAHFLKYLLCAQHILSQLSICYLIFPFALQMRDLVVREQQPPGLL